MLEKIFIFIFGTLVGSFLNVCIYRLPKDASIIKPRSFCPECKTGIKWYENIPLLSYLALRAKCSNCRTSIPFRYFFVELLSGLFFLILYLKFGLSLIFAKFIFLFCLLIVVSFIDLKYHAIPAYLCFLGIAWGLVCSLIVSIQIMKSGPLALSALPIVRDFKGLIFGFGFAYLFKFFGDVGLDLYLKFRKKESIEGEKESLGLGDVDFMGMIGVFLGIKAVILVFFLAPFVAVAYSIFALIFKKSHLIPYLPYLSLATIIVFFWGDKILNLIF